MLYRKKPIFLLKNIDGVYKFLIVPISNFSDDNLHMIVSYNNEN